MRATLTEILASSRIGEEEQTADGRRILRCRVPFRFSMPDGGATVARAKAAEETETPEGDVVRLRGVASSTSVDWYDTEMSKNCLDQMAAQMSVGVPILPKHPSWSGEGGEWDDEMGRTVKASVEMMPVANPHEDSAGKEYVLTFEAELDADDPKVQTLERRAKRGQPIGTSIGGWMLRVIFEEDDDGDISRVIIDDIELDHHALTRSPANPDANYIEVFRSLAAAARPAPVVAAAPVPIPDEIAVEQVEESTPPAPTETPIPDGPAVEAAPLEVEHHEERGTPAPGEDDMEPKVLEELQSLAAKVNALEARTAAPVVSPEDKIAALQARNEELEAEVRATRDRPNVRGIATVRDATTNKVRVLKGRPAQVHRAMVMAEATGQAPLLREALSDSSAKILTAYDPHRAMKPEEKGLDARQILCDALNAADEDGSLNAWRN